MKVSQNWVNDKRCIVVIVVLDSVYIVTIQSLVELGPVMAVIYICCYCYCCFCFVVVVVDDDDVVFVVVLSKKPSIKV